MKRKALKNHRNTIGLLTMSKMILYLTKNEELLSNRSLHLSIRLQILTNRILLKMMHKLTKNIMKNKMMIKLIDKEMNLYLQDMSEGTIHRTRS